jgi:hypothetical protein
VNIFKLPVEVSINDNLDSALDVNVLRLLVDVSIEVIFAL